MSHIRPIAKLIADGAKIEVYFDVVESSTAPLRRWRGRLFPRMDAVQFNRIRVEAQNIALELPDGRRGRIRFDDGEVLSPHDVSEKGYAFSGAGPLE